MKSCSGLLSCFEDRAVIGNYEQALPAWVVTDACSELPSCSRILMAHVLCTITHAHPGVRFQPAADVGAGDF